VAQTDWQHVAGLQLIPGVHAGLQRTRCVCGNFGGGGGGGILTVPSVEPSGPPYTPRWRDSDKERRRAGDISRGARDLVADAYAIQALVIDCPGLCVAARGAVRLPVAEHRHAACRLVAGVVRRARLIVLALRPRRAGDAGGAARGSCAFKRDLRAWYISFSGEKGFRGELTKRTKSQYARFAPQGNDCPQP
jgi:hypothetical protein